MCLACVDTDSYSILSLCKSHLLYSSLSLPLFATSVCWHDQSRSKESLRVCVWLLVSVLRGLESSSFFNVFSVLAASKPLYSVYWGWCVGGGSIAAVSVQYTSSWDGRVYTHFSFSLQEDNTLQHTTLSFRLSFVGHIVYVNIEVHCLLWRAFYMSIFTIQSRKDWYPISITLMIVPDPLVTEFECTTVVYWVLYTFCPSQ